jgi:putative acetyltransferase
MRAGLAFGAAGSNKPAMREYTIREDDLTGPEIAALLRLHLDEMHRWSPPDSVHAMPIERLRAPDVTFYTAWDGDRLTACGALKQLDVRHGELKSMRADPAWRGQGAGKAILLHLLAEARARGYTRLSLETGATDEFIPARRLYANHGFGGCGPFTGYDEDPFSIFMTRTL